jgi:hypothetical protein
MTIELSKTQIAALQSGAAHAEGHITFPATLRGGARQKVLTSLVTGKLAGCRSGTLVITPEGIAALGRGDVAIEPEATSELPASDGAEHSDHAGEATDAPSVTITSELPTTAATSAGESEPSVDAAESAPAAPVEPQERAESPPMPIEPVQAVPGEGARPARQPRTDTKQARLIEMLRRPEGATIDEVVKALDWQAHTVRGAIAGALKKKLGLKVESEKVDAERGRTYRITE